MVDVKSILQGLKPELMACKTKWTDEVKLKTGKSKEEPFPISVKRRIPQPPVANMWDVDELTIVLSVDGPSVLPGKPAVGDIGYHVVCAQKNVPAQLREQIEKAVETMWGKELAANVGKGANGGQAWRLEAILQWVEAKYTSLISLVPECIEMYEGCDANGATMRRYTVQEPVVTEEAPQGSGGEEDDGEAEDEDDIDEAEKARRQAVMDKKRAEKEAKLEAAARKKEADAIKKRLDAENGLAEHRHVQKSKKEMEAEWDAKHKQGQRMSKTGPRRKKFDGEGSAIAREEAEKKKGGKKG